MFLLKCVGLQSIFLFLQHYKSCAPWAYHTLHVAQDLTTSHWCGGIPWQKES